jgi:hypothetical protein
MIKECSQELRLPGEIKIKIKHELTGILLSAFNYISRLFLQPKTPAIYYQIKKQTKHSLAYLFNQFLAGPVYKLSKGLAEIRDRPKVDNIKIAEIQNDSFSLIRRHNKNGFLKEYNRERRTHDIIARFMKSGLWNTAAATSLVALTLIWSLWYQGILSIESNPPISNSYVIKPNVPASDEAEYHAAPLAKSKVVDKTEAMGFTKEPSGKLEPTDPGLKEKYKVNNLDDFDKVATNNMGETKKTEPSIIETARRQLSVQKSTDVDWQDVGKSESSIGPMWTGKMLGNLNPPLAFPIGQKLLILFRWVRFYIKKMLLKWQAF